MLLTQQEGHEFKSMMFGVTVPVCLPWKLCMVHAAFNPVAAGISQSPSRFNAKNKTKPVELPIMSCYLFKYSHLFNQY